MAHLFDDAKLTAKQAGIALGLLDRKHLEGEGFKRLDVFEYGGRYFLANYESAVLCFVQNNPTGGDFYVWLQDHYREIKILPR
jgi:hypothetical protein